jgi:hypothetical protein
MTEPQTAEAQTAEPDARPAQRVDLDQLAIDEDERRFLLRSIDDLDAELAAGDIDADDHDRLRTDYSARLADVQRRIEGDETALAQIAVVRSRRSRLIPIGAGVATFVFALGAGLLVARSAGERKAGQTITGNAPLTKSAKIQELMAQASAEMATNPLAAVKTYDEVTKLEPRTAAAWAYGGWTLRLTAIRITDETQQAAVRKAALRRLDEAIRLDPTYPDARAFRAVLKYRDLNDATGAKVDLQALETIDHEAVIDQLTRGIREELGMAKIAPPTT